jgi:hypothetical protein
VKRFIAGYCPGDERELLQNGECTEMDAKVSICGLFLILIAAGALSIFFGISRIANAEWVWNFERSLRWLGDGTKRDYWKQYRYIVGFIAILVGATFMLLALLTFCPTTIAI